MIAGCRRKGSRENDGDNLYVAAVDDLVDELIERYQLALGEFMKGDPKPAKDLFSHREDASLANSYGPPMRGWEQITEVMEHAASLRRDGEATSFEIVAKYVTPELATLGSWNG